MHDSDRVVETRFGAFRAMGADTVDMVSALPGFESCHRYVLLSDPSLAPFMCLQGLDDPQPSFLTLAPRSIVPRYRQALNAAERRRLGARRREPLLWLSIVRVDGDRAFANLRAPVVINPRRMLGLQVLSADGDASLDYPLIVE